MADPYRIQFVSSVAATPTVNLDLNNDSPWRVLAATDLTPPALNRAIAGTLLTDGQVIPAAAYANRTVTLVLQLQDPPGGPALTEDDCATALQNLFRQLDRNQNVLLWQPNTTNPVFFRTFRADVSAAAWDPLTKTVTAAVPAEPFAVGPETSLGTFTFTEPSSAIYQDVTGILGDVETPLKVVFPASGTSIIPATQTLFGTRRSLQSISLVPHVMCSAATPSIADTTLSSGKMHTTFATSTALNARFTVPTSLGANRDTRGRYRVYAKVQKSVSGDTITLQLANVAGPNASLANDIVTLQATANPTMIELGYITIPYGADPITEGYSGADGPSANEVTLSLAASRSGSGNLDVTYFILVPADDQTVIVARPAYGSLTSNEKQIWDPRGQFYRVQTSGGLILGSTPAAFVGANRLMVSPGMTNRIFCFGNVTPGADLTGGPFGGASSITLTLSCYPRYLFVRPKTT